MVRRETHISRDDKIANACGCVIFHFEHVITLFLEIDLEIRSVTRKGIRMAIVS